MAHTAHSFQRLPEYHTQVHAKKQYVTPSTTPNASIRSHVLLVDVDHLILLNRGASTHGPDLQVLEDLLAGARSKAPGDRQDMVSDTTSLGSIQFSRLAGCLLDKGVLVRDETLGINDLLLRVLDDAVCGVLGEGHEEGLLRLDGEDAADGGKSQGQVCHQLHCCGLLVWWTTVRGGINR